MSGNWWEVCVGETRERCYAEDCSWGSVTGSLMVH